MTFLAGLCVAVALSAVGGNPGFENRSTSFIETLSRTQAPVFSDAGQMDGATVVPVRKIAPRPAPHPTTVPHPTTTPHPTETPGGLGGLGNDIFNPRPTDSTTVPSIRDVLNRHVEAAETEADQKVLESALGPQLVMENPGAVKALLQKMRASRTSGIDDILSPYGIDPSGLNPDAKDLKMVNEVFGSDFAAENPKAAQRLLKAMRTAYSTRPRLPRVPQGPIEITPERRSMDIFPLAATARMTGRLKSAHKELNGDTGSGEGAVIIVGRFDAPVPGIYRLSRDGKKTIVHFLEAPPSNALALVEATVVQNIDNFLRGAGVTPGGVMRIHVLGEEGITPASVDAALLSVALAAQRNLGISAIEWVGSKENPTSFLSASNGRLELGEGPLSVGVPRLMEHTAGFGPRYELQLQVRAEKQAKVTLLAKTTTMVRQMYKSLMGWFGREKVESMSDADVVASLKQMVNAELKTYLDRNPKLGAAENPDARFEFESGVQSLWATLDSLWKQYAGAYVILPAPRT